MARSEIIAVGKLASATLLQEIVERLRSLGHRVEFFEDGTAFHEANATLADTDVALLAPRFSCPRDIIATGTRLRGLVSPITGIGGIP